mmetsp:Transcript_23449/g.30634  ORF Transcript_23449/g.30634 Transcript_23449/m.30634 type:complete len:423 (+) Transcript_23449:82-1350(+)
MEEMEVNEAILKPVAHARQLKEVSDEVAEKRLVSMLQALDTTAPRSSNLEKANEPASTKVSPRRPTLEPLVLHRSNSVPDSHSSKNFMFNTPHVMMSPTKSPKRSPEESRDMYQHGQPRDSALSNMLSSGDEEEGQDFTQPLKSNATPKYIQSRAQLIVSNPGTPSCRFDVPNTRTPSGQSGAFFGQDQKHEAHHLKAIDEVNKDEDQRCSDSILTNRSKDLEDPIPMEIRTRTNREVEERKQMLQPRNFSCLSSDYDSEEEDGLEGGKEEEGVEPVEEASMPMALRTRTNKELKEQENKMQPRNFSCLTSDDEAEEEGKGDSMEVEASTEGAERKTDLSEDKGAYKSSWEDKTPSPSMDLRAQLVVSNPRTPSMKFNVPAGKTPRSGSAAFFPHHQTKFSEENEGLRHISEEGVESSAPKS